MIDFPQFQELPMALQTAIAHASVRQMTVSEFESQSFEETAALNHLCVAFHHAYQPCIQEWHDLFENPQEFGDTSHTLTQNELKYSPTPLTYRKSYIISQEFHDPDAFAFYYQGHPLGQYFDPGGNDDTWQLYIGYQCRITQIVEYTPDPRLTLVDAATDEPIESVFVPTVSVKGIPETSFRVPPDALVAV